MQSEAAVESFAALAHATRLNVFRTLLSAGPGGLSAGVLAETLSVSPSNLSAHLAVLTRAGLVSARTHGRSRIYTVETARVAGLLEFLVSDCCNGRPEVCGPALAALSRAR